MAVLVIPSLHKLGTHEPVAYQEEKTRKKEAHWGRTLVVVVVEVGVGGWGGEGKGSARTPSVERADVWRGHIRKRRNASGGALIKLLCLVCGGRMCKHFPSRRKMPPSVLFLWCVITTVYTHTGVKLLSPSVTYNRPVFARKKRPRDSHGCVAYMIYVMTLTGCLCPVL